MMRCRAEKLLGAVSLYKTANVSVSLCFVFVILFMSFLHLKGTTDNAVKSMDLQFTSFTAGIKTCVIFEKRKNLILT
jgi:hypothetical protein